MSIEARNEPAKPVAQFAKEKKLTQRFLVAAKDVATNYRVKRVPVTLWIDRNGTIMDRQFGFNGPKPLEEKTRRLVDRHG